MPSRMDTITVAGKPMSVYVATPEGKGPFPAVVVMFHRAGIDNFTKDRVDRLAAAGFAAAAPDLFHRVPGGVENPEVLSLLRDADVLEDTSAAAEHLIRTGLASPDRMAILGHCMGGRAAFLGASSTPYFRAAVIHYCGNMFKPWGEGPSAFERLPGLKGSVIGFFGNDDKNPSPADVDRIDAELKRLGVPHEFHRYDGAGHAFQNFVRPEQLRPQAAEDSWTKGLAFLKRTIGAQSAPAK
ncbi:MAG TPA: dienelactone hydrolase family protein [Alphaproteobacteria bacterium]|jgi:carboxymethylenebutenolidase|nr:dienelactone hydrolase family protein [Alphaproteobacteria bacterium]